MLCLLSKAFPIHMYALLLSSHNTCISLLQAILRKCLEILSNLFSNQYLLRNFYKFAEILWKFRVQINNYFPTVWLYSKGSKSIIGLGSCDPLKYTMYCVRMGARQTDHTKPAQFHQRGLFRAGQGRMKRGNVEEGKEREKVRGSFFYLGRDLSRHR